MICELARQDRAVLEAGARRECMTATLGGGRVICRVLGRYLMYVQPDDLGITPHLAMNGCWEPWVTLAVARLLRPGWRCVDVGANVGYYSLLMADAVGEGGRVLALEPNPDAAQLLTLNVEVNGFDGRVRIERCAASDGSKPVEELTLESARSGQSSICVETAGSRPRIRVPACTVDSLVADWASVDLVKIDAEGAEPLVWAGMQATLARWDNLVVLMEFSPSRYSDPFAFLADIAEAGYVPRQIAGDGSLVALQREEVEAIGASGGWTMLFLVRG